MDRNKLLDAANRTIQKTFGFFADRVSDHTVETFNRPDYTDFLEGSGYFLKTPKESACWRVGYAKASILPEHVTGPLYVGGYLSFPPNRVSGVLNDQLIRATALDDGSGRGVHVFACVDCIGISNTDVREIRKRLKKEIADYNIESINISATHCHSGVDTLGLWGDLTQAVKKNPKLVKSNKHVDEAVSGRNPDFMQQFFETAVDCIREALADLRPASAASATLDASVFARDKRPPLVIDPYVTILRFQRDNGKPLYWVVLGAHPTCYGDSQREISSDFPYYICSEIERHGADAVFYQGAQAAVAADRAKWSAPQDTRNESIEHFGRAIAAEVLSVADDRYTPVSPLLNVRNAKVLLPAQNSILLLAAKLKLVNHTLNKFKLDKKRFAYYFNTEVGFAEFGTDLTFALMPGELMPELAYGGTLSAADSFNHTQWPLPALESCVNGRLAVIGLCNDTIGYIVPENDFGNYLMPNHYEEAVSPGKRTASELVSSFIRTVREAENTRI